MCVQIPRQRLQRLETLIAASDYATFGLTDDGRLLCTGFYDYSEPED